jgi:hypothetical protein
MMVANDWIVALAFVAMLTGAYAVIGHLVFSTMLRRRGVPIPWVLSNVPFYAEFRYFAHRPPVRSKTLDAFMISVNISFVVAVILIILLIPQLGGGSAGL